MRHKLKCANRLSPDVRIRGSFASNPSRVVLSGVPFGPELTMNESSCILLGNHQAVRGGWQWELGSAPQIATRGATYDECSKKQIGNIA